MTICEGQGENIRIAVVSLKMQYSKNSKWNDLTCHENECNLRKCVRRNQLRGNNCELTVRQMARTRTKDNLPLLVSGSESR
jgi:hypothetical protein